MSDYSSSRVYSYTHSIRETVLRQAGRRCWADRWLADWEDVIPVINWIPDGSEDRAIKLLSERGMINFRLSSASNAIALCPNCAQDFRNGLDPRWLIVPTDLEYFISFEKRDFEKRCQRLRETGCLLMRTCPTRQMYRDHQVRQGLISPREAGGLYRVIVLNNRYEGADWMVELRRKNSPLPADYPYETDPKVWHGAPMAMIRHAFIGLSSIRIDKIPPAVADSLRQLQYLYSREPAVDMTSEDTEKALVRLSYDHIRATFDKNSQDDNNNNNSNKRPRNDDNSEIALPESKRTYPEENYTQAIITTWQQGVVVDDSTAPKNFSLTDTQNECLPLHVSPEPCKPVEIRNSRCWVFSADDTSSMIVEKMLPLYEKIAASRNHST